MCLRKAEPGPQQRPRPGRVCRAGLAQSIPDPRGSRVSVAWLGLTAAGAVCTDRAPADWSLGVRLLAVGGQ